MHTESWHFIKIIVARQFKMVITVMYPDDFNRENYLYEGRAMKSIAGTRAALLLNRISGNRDFIVAEIIIQENP